MCNRAEPQDVGHGHGEHQGECLLLLWGGVVCLTLQSLRPQPGPELLTAEALRRPRGLPVSEAQRTGDLGAATVKLYFSEMASPLVAREP